MQPLHRLIQEAADAVTLNGRQKFFERVSISIEGIIPNSRVSFLVEHFKRPIVIGAGGPVDAQYHRNLVLDELSGEF
ncbi:hypothetical protein EKH55_1497 [Sinorhizobium alkalisoli]|nr:hypothetical protein EKH55_1497 [Sinorhizobium alkalisoli]